MSYQQDKFKEIADTIRGFTGKTDKIKPADFHNEIRGMAAHVYQQGVEQGKAEGGGETLPDADVMEFPLAEISIGRVSTDSEYYTEIANAISEYGDYRSCKPSEMRHGVYSVQKRQYESGFSDGQEEGYANGLTEGEAQGRQAQYDEFWDDFQSNGAAKSYMRYFQGAGWSDLTFNPKYDIVATNLQATFYGNNRITRIPVLVDMSRITNNNYTSQSFYSCSSLASLSLKVAETTPWNLNTFQTCSALENLTIDGTIGMNNFDVHWSTRLSDVSLLSILTACNKSAAGLSITLPTTAEAKIKNSTKLSTAATNAGDNGYTILYD